MPIQRRRRPLPNAHSLKICFVTSECVPFAKAGGLADVSGALPARLARLDDALDVRIMMPLYRGVDRAGVRLRKDTEVRELTVRLGRKKAVAQFRRAAMPGSPSVEIVFVENDAYFDRESIYSDARDESDRFLFFQRAVADYCVAADWIPDVVHANDWPTGLMPALLRRHPALRSDYDRTVTVFSIHNIGYQGIFDQRVVGRAGLPKTLAAPFAPLEYYGDTSFLKAGIALADVITTVSPTYAREIQTPEFGRGLDGDIRARGKAVKGILNGIDTEAWNPASDPHLPSTYGLDTLGRKRYNTHALRDRLGLSIEEDVPLIGIVARLTEQKGFQLLEPVLDDLLETKRFQLVVLGNGDPDMERMFEDAANRHAGTVAVHIGYDESLSHLIEAGSDIFLMPSMYEPCGLNQMYSLRYGTVPVVRKTGGLADTVFDVDEFPRKGNGFVFEEADSSELKRAVLRACDLYDNKRRWRTLQRRGMKQDFSWESSATAYRRLYLAAVRARRRVSR